MPDKLKTNNKEFVPAWWLLSPHFQTLWPHIFKKQQKSELSTERLYLPDGDFVDLCWSKVKSGQIIIVLHGLEGSIHSSYAMGIMSAIDNIGWTAVFMHFRGCSGETNRIARSYHSGDSNDIAFLIETLKSRYPDAPLAAVGYSLGGNVLLKYLGEDRKHGLRAAVAVSVPFSLENSAEKLEKGFSCLYQKYLIRRLKGKLAIKFKIMECPVSLSKLSELNTFKLFDDHITAPLRGFANVDDYYSRCSCRQFLKSIQVPTLICHAADDPFMTTDAIPDEDELSEQVTLELSETGGHVGFIAGKLPWKPIYWLEHRIPEFLGDYVG